MIIKSVSKEKLKEYNGNLCAYVEAGNSLYDVFYLDLGTTVVRLLCYSKEFIPHLQKQMTYTLRENAQNFDTTIVLWKENDIKQLYKVIAPEFNPRDNLKLRIEMLQHNKMYEDLFVYDNNYSVNKPVLSVNLKKNIVSSYDAETNTYYYGVENLEPEEFIKKGHLFVQILNEILKTKNTTLVHGACIGLDNEGILLCARGQRGKSTLAVLAMMEGFEYVSDDYLTLEKDGKDLYAHPIYSIITLSPRMYNELYDRLDGCRFISNNAKKDKYVINISKFHPQFKKRYPVKMCMFPEIVSDIEPSIQECSVQEKGRAITHIVHSTIFQMHDKHDMETIKKIMNMVKDFKFYKINLCNDIYKNVECLRKFCNSYSKNNTVSIR